jgi:hypothetical protein
MDFTGRQMRGFVTVEQPGLRGRALDRWIQDALRWVESLPPK